jgi:hypothetical protein
MPQRRSLESQKTNMGAQEDFWTWFKYHEDELFNFEQDREAVFDRLAGELRKVETHLTFEFGPKKIKREFVISAGGIKSAFPAVSALVHAAPALERWQVTAFRPRRPVINVVEFRGRRVDPKDVQFSLLDNGRVAGLHLFIPGFDEGDADLKQIGYLMLDDALGEYDVEARLGLIKMFPRELPTQDTRHPLSDLPNLFDRLVSRLEGRSQRPS